MTQHEHAEFITANGRDYLCIFRRDGSGGYGVTCPELPPMAGFGETFQQARANAAEEIAAWLDAPNASFDPFTDLRAHRAAEAPPIAWSGRGH